MRPLGAIFSAALGALALICYDLTLGDGVVRYLGLQIGILPGSMGLQNLLASGQQLFLGYPQFLLQAALWAAMAGIVSAPSGSVDLSSGCFWRRGWGDRLCFYSLLLPGCPGGGYDFSRLGSYNIRCVEVSWVLGERIVFFGFLQQIEKRMETLVEGVFGRAFRRQVHPVEIAKGLTKQMDEGKMVSVSRTYAPTTSPFTSPRRTASQSRPTKDRSKTS